MNDLLRVVPVGQTQTIDDISVTLLSVEIYADAITVAGRIRTTRTDDDEKVDWMLVVDGRSYLTITDERAQSYALSLSAGSGDRQQYRFIYTFGGALDSNLGTLTVKLADVRLVRFDRLAPDDRSRDILVHGPWSFEVSL